MGGFMKYEGNRPIRVLLPEQLGSYSLTGNGNFPRVSKADIKDRSKGDALSKGFVVMQTGWFVTQCIARGVQGLPITELELVTVAFAVLNFVIYVLWWEKPLNVQRGVRVYKKRNTEEPVDDGDVEAAVGFWIALRDALSRLPAAIIRGPEKYDESDRASWLPRVVFRSINNMVLVIRGISLSENPTYRVRTFYPDEWGGNVFMGGSLVIAITLGFGSIHCIGWSFLFPSNAERMLWRAAAICIIGVPIVYIPALISFRYNRFLFRTPLLPQFLLPRFLLILYTLSRLTLLVLPFLCLRSLPPTAYHVVHWTSLIPHV
jgi:hypothetical protein